MAPKARGDDRTVDDGRREDALRAFVAAVTRRQLEAPALFLLEVARPFHLFLQQALYLAHPFLRPWSGERLLGWADLLEDGEAVEQALRLLAQDPRPEAT